MSWKSIGRVRRELEIAVGLAKLNGQPLLQSSLDSLTQTERFLAACEKLGIKLVSVDTPTKRIASSLRGEWPPGCVFTRDNVCWNGWPAIWEAVERTPGLKLNCGNPGQVQYTGKMLPGVWRWHSKRWHREMLP